MGAVAVALLAAAVIVVVARGGSDHGPWLIEHGFDVSTAAQTAANAGAISELPFDGISIKPEHNPCSAVAVDPAAAVADLAAMPDLGSVRHNFVLCRFYDNATGDGTSPYDIGNEATWTALTANLAAYAEAARQSGRFDGVMIDTEYYGKGPNPWDYDTEARPLDGVYPAERPWQLPDEARAAAQARGKQVADAIREVWPDVVIFALRGVSLSDPATFDPGHLGGNQVAWANELSGPFHMGLIESVSGTKATYVDGGESYRQRSAADFERAVAWLATGMADSGGPMVPSGAVSADDYKRTVSVATNVFDRDVTADLAAFSADEVAQLLVAARGATQTYYWFYSEQFDWRGTGHPTSPAPSDAVAALKAAR